MIHFAGCFALATRSRAHLLSYWMRGRLALSLSQDYFYGLTEESDPKFTIEHDRSDPIEGRMQRRGGEPTSITLKCDPNGAAGTYEAFLCFILPEEKDFSTFYKITCVCK